MTAPTFLRLATPSYFGGLPAGYGYINNATSGTPAPANGVVTGGPNIGSYFVGFGDDGTSADANRPAQALATNTDFIDNLLHQDLAYITKTTDVGPTGSPTPTITLAGPNIWMGNAGGYLLRDLFHVVDSNDQDIVVSGTQIVVASFTGGSVGGGFSTGALVLTLNTPIPTGTTWHIYYGLRTNLASLPEDALILPFMRDEGAVTANIANFVAQVSAPGVLGQNVTSLQAYSFSTPDGHSLAQAAVLYMDCDPNDTGAVTRGFFIRTRKNSVGRILGALYDDPTSSLIAGLTGYLQLDAGTAFASAGTLLLDDANLIAPVGMFRSIPLTTTGTAQGDNFPRIMEAPAAIGTVAPSLLRMVNGRWACTCGDGLNSFGDFNGAGSLDAALTYAAAQSVTSLHIQLKRGTFTLSGNYSFTGDVLIEGVSSGQTVITTAAGATVILNAAAPGSVLTLRNMTISHGSGSGNTITSSAGSAMFLDGVVLNGTAIVSTSANRYRGIAALKCTNCQFNPSATNIYAVTIGAAGGEPDPYVHDGYIFRDCAFNCVDESGPVQIMFLGAASTGVSGVLFDGCKYSLGGTATTAAHLTTNTGVLYINPNGVPGLNLTVTDVTWNNCYPVCATTSLANSVLARVVPIGTGDNSTSHLTFLVSLTIKGGVWQCGSASAISPMLLAASSITVEDTAFIGLNGSGSTGGPSSEDQFVLDGVSRIAADWHQFIFAPGAQTNVLPGQLTMHNASFRGFHPQSTSGDLWLYLTGYVDVDGLRLTVYGTGGSGSLPNARVRISSNDAQGDIRNLYVHGINPGTGNTFTNFSNRGGAGLILIQPATDSDVTVRFGLTIDGFAYTTNFDDGIVLVNPTTGTPAWPFHFNDCRVEGCQNGLSLYGTGTAGSGGNGRALDGLVIRGGNFRLNNNSGIQLRPDIAGVALIDGVLCENNTGRGLLFNPATWVAAFPSLITVVNSTFSANNGDVVQASFLSGDSSSKPHVMLKGNGAFTSAGVTAPIQIQTGNGGGLPSADSLGAVTFAYGFQTGTTGASALFTNGGQMMDNAATLQTPG